MQATSLQAFVPAGPDIKKAAELFKDLGFNVRWDGGDYIGFEKDGFGFILQQYDNRSFAENFMLSVNITDADAFYRDVTERKLAEKHGARFSSPKNQPYGREVNLVDIAGVCWHFVSPL